MDVQRFGLGLRFDLLDATLTGDVGRRIFEEIFSVLTVNDTKGLRVYGGKSTDVNDADENIYLVVFTGGSLSRTKRIFAKLDADAGIAMYLSSTRPFIQTNALLRIEPPTYFGIVQKNGMIEGGEKSLGILIPHRRGKRRAAGKGVKIVLAPDKFEGSMTSMEAIKRLTLAARRHMLGVKVAPVPMVCCGIGALEALVTACGGTYRNARVNHPAQDEKPMIKYGVINGKTAVLNIEESGSETSAAPGDLLRRVLDEGIKDVLFTNAMAEYPDGGEACLDVLGIPSPGGKARQAGVHPRLENVRFTVMDDPSCLSAAMRRIFLTIAPFAADMRFAPPADAFLDAVKFEVYLKRGAALVVTGEGRLDNQKVPRGQAVTTVIKRATRLKVPVAVIAGNLSGDVNELYALSNAGIMTTVNLSTDDQASLNDRLSSFDDAADRMFRFIRMGRDVNKKQRKRLEQY